MIREMLRILIAVVALTFLPVEAADACSCAPGSPPCADYWGVAALFRGRVEAIDPEPSAAQDPFPGKLVRFTVLERFVGAGGPEVTVWTAGSGSACGYRFAVNREYVVYAHKGKEGRLTTGICTRTTPVERASADLEYARNVRSGQPLGLIEVMVNLFIRHGSGGSPGSNSRPLSGVAISLRHGDESFSGPTDRAGRFARSGLQPGTYEVEVKPPAGTRLYNSEPQTIELPDARACAATEFALLPDGRISGRVVDAAGGGVRGLTIGLRVAPTGSVATPEATSLQVLTDADGRFEIADVPPGRFLLAAESTDAGRVLFPGVGDHAKAERFELRLGSRLTAKDFRLPEVLTISGVALDAGRVPMEGARVYLREPADGGAIVTLPVVTDWSGRFVISVPAGQEYVIFAERDRPGAALRTDASEPIRIGPRSPDQPLVLTLRRRY